MKKFKKISLIFTTFTLLFSSCKKNNSDNNSSSDPQINLNDALPDVSVKKERFTPISYDEDLTNLDTSLGNKQSSSIMDVNKDYAVRVVSKGAYLSNSDISSYIEVKDQYDKNVSFDTALSSSNSQTAFLITSKEGYIEGECYSITLKNEAPLFFENKDESIRRLSFSIKKSDTKNITYKNDFKKADYSSIIENHTNLDINYLITSSKLNEQIVKGDIVLFEDTNDQDNNVYIKFLSQENYDSGKYKINYTDPSAEEIFEDLEIHKDSLQINMDENFKSSSDEEIKKSILNSDFLKEYAAAIAYSYNLGDGWIDFWKSAKVIISFYTLNLELNAKISVTFTHKDKGFVIMANLCFEYSRKVTVSADCKIKKFAGIPYGASISCANAVDDLVSVKLQVYLAKSGVSPKVEEKEPNDLNWDDAKSAVANLDKTLDTDDKKSEAMSQHMEGATLMVLLGTINIPIAEVLMIDLEVYFCATLSGSAGLAIGYTWSQHQVCLQYSNSSNSDSSASSSPEISKAASVESTFFGKLNIDFYLKFRLSLYLVGLKKLVRLTADIDFGVYLQLTGSGSINYNITSKTFNLEAGVTLDIGLFIRITISIILFDYHAFNYDICEIKSSMFKLGSTDRIEELASDIKVELHKNETKIDDTNLLTFNVFDSNSFKHTIKKYSYKANRIYVSGFLVNSKSEPFFSSIVPGDDKLKIEDGKIIVNSSLNEFDSSIIVSIKSLSSSPDNKITIPVHYVKEGVHYVTFDGSDKTAYVEGEIVKFKIPEAKDGYRFKGYSIDGVNIIDTSTYKMGKTDIDFKSIYVSNQKFKVTYYDGFNNKVGEEEVLNETAAKGLDPKVRDKNMAGYIFIGYDVDLNSVTKDIEAHALYVKVEAK